MHFYCMNRIRLRSLANRSAGVMEDEPAFDLSSLIDVSFLLLIYFLVTSTLQPKEADLGVHLGGTIPIADREYISEPLTIDITAEGVVMVGDQASDPASSGRTLPGLQDRLRLYVATQRILNEDPVVTVNAHDEANSQRFIDVVNCVAGERIEHVVFGNFRVTEN